MNFGDLSFWLVLFSALIIFLVVRSVGSLFGSWSSSLDKIGLLAISLMIFWFASALSFTIFVVELLVNYGIVQVMQKQAREKAFLLASVAISFNVCILLYFKYFNFIFENLSFLDNDVVIQSLASVKVQEIPPGISFYTFQMVAFIIDSFRRRDEKNLAFVDYLNFVTFFPQVVAGPIERRDDLLPQVRSFVFQFSFKNLEAGLRWVALGLFFKLVLGDNLASFIHLNEVTNPWAIWLSIILFGLRIYYDFAGYSFIALGLAKTLGIHLTLNFVAPYVSCSVQEFWRRWHITLSTWFRDYVYFPLGGSKVAWATLNIFLVFTLSGLWHGASWNFILWGAYHGVLLILQRYLGKVVQLPGIVAWAITMSSVMMGWLFFMETDLNRLVLKLQTLTTPAAYLSHSFTSAVTGSNTAFTIILLLCTGVLLSEHIARWKKCECVYDFLLSPWVARVLAGLTVLLSSQASADFVYFAF